MENALPILYSFRRCPYAIRARLAIAYAGIAIEIREVQLKHKPEQMLVISPKGTVPVLQLPDGKVLDESLDIMRWALAQNDPDNWLDVVEDAGELILWNDGEFKYFLDRYKYADRYPEFPPSYYRSQAEKFLAELEARLARHPFLSGHHYGLLDAAILSFIRQFAAVDNLWFQASDYRRVIDWLKRGIATDLFASVMIKYAIWNPLVDKISEIRHN